MILATDTYYLPDNTAKVVGVLFHTWSDEAPAQVLSVTCTEVADYEYRGESKNPLFVSSIGVPPEVAAGHIASMYGPYRMPHLLQLLDRTTKEP